VFALALPSEKEINTVIKSTKGDLSIALQILKECGVRVGILPSLTIRDGRYSGWSKGRQITGDMPEEIIDRMKKLKMNLNCPFKCWNDKKIKNQIQYRITRLCNKGIIQTRFSPHDLRHVKAINEYKKSHDIIKVKQLLNHASISMTDIYLRGLGVI
jgi:integrase